MRWSGKVAHISGFVPVSLLGELREVARRKGWGLAISDPDTDELVPTRYRRFRLIALIQPVFNLLGVVSGYREHDVSVWFLLFFSIFFAMIIGDAGYGALLVLATMLMRLRRRRRKLPRSQGLALMTLMGWCVLIWGAVSGNWFGSPEIARQTVLGLLVVPQLDSFEPRSFAFVQWVCFLLGTVHMTIAHGWRFFAELRRKPRIRAIAQLGWLSLLWGLYSLVVVLVLGEDSFFR